MDPEAAYRQLNRGERVGAEHITRAHWEGFAPKPFWSTVFYSPLPIGNCRTTVLIDHFHMQIQNGIDYLVHVRNIAFREGAPHDQIAAITAAHQTLESYTRRGMDMQWTNMRWTREISDVSSGNYLQ